MNYRLTLVLVSLFSLSTSMPAKNTMLACRAFWGDFSDELQSGASDRSASSQACVKAEAMLSVCGTAIFPVKELGEIAERCPGDIKRMSRAEAATQIIEATVKQWPKRDGAQGLWLSDQFLFALLIRPESVHRLEPVINFD